MSEPKIMIVEDDEDLQVLYGLYLQGENFQIVRAFNGKQALDIVEKEKPDLIILDMIMPIMDGEEFFIKLRTEKKMNTQVIIASVNEKISKKLFDLGHIYATLRKPFTIDVLIGKIKEALHLGSRA